jgi:triphosphoribosyl-dephospho-CoA synthetase
MNPFDPNYNDYLADEVYQDSKRAREHDLRNMHRHVNVHRVVQAFDEEHDTRRYPLREYATLTDLEKAMKHRENIRKHRLDGFDNRRRMGSAPPVREAPPAPAPVAQNTIVPQGQSAMAWMQQNPGKATAAGLAGTAAAAGIGYGIYKAVDHYRNKGNKKHRPQYK